MDCPQCQSDQLDDSGVCPSCGYRASSSVPVEEPDSDDNENRPVPGMIEIDYAEGEQDIAQKAERPQWRQELSKRLQAIRQKRESVGLSQRLETIGIDAPPAAQRPSAVRPPVVPPVKLVEGPPIRISTSKPLTPVPRQKILEPLSPERPAQKPSQNPSDPRDIQNLIDNAVSRKSPPPGEPDESAGFLETTEGAMPDYEGKLILLSRTLCGLIDLIIVLLCTGVLVLAADFVSGIISLDAVSYMYFSVLFLLTYFFYSLFFLAASNQTIGMMITDLRVVGIYHERPSFRQLIHRCSGFLLSLFGLGFGLIWGFFDRDSLCFHDRISDTQVIRQ